MPMKNKIKYWLISQKWLWKLIIFDNGVVGNQYHRYDHRIFSYSQGMGNNGEYGDINKAIELQLWFCEFLNKKI